jgi:hypothetical protein
MRRVKEIDEKREQGFYPCRYPKCQDYGNIADRKHGVVCKGHSSVLLVRGCQIW